MLCGMRGIGAVGAAAVGPRPLRRAVLAFVVVTTVLVGLLGMHVLELHGTSAAAHAASGMAPHAEVVSVDGAAASSGMHGADGMSDAAGMVMMCVLALLLVAFAVRLRRRSVLRIPALARGSVRRRLLPRLAPRIPDPPTPLLLGISRT